MKLITRNTDYAIRALRCIAGHNNEVLSADEMVKALDMPRPFLRRILQTLNKEGILSSFKGKGGGFSLALPPKKITLTRLMKVFQGDFRINECTFKKEVCPHIDTCLLKKKLDKIGKEVFGKLEKITLDSLLEKEKNPKKTM